jgi:hypothetical protein
VSVIEGEVEVRIPGVQHVLAPGEQVTTSDRLHTVAISDQIAWSRHADRHVALLHELTTLHREVADAVEPRTTRTSTTLLELAPPDTLIYAAVPNLAEGLGEARRILDERLAASEALRQWWDDNVVANGLDREIEDLLDRLQPLGEAVGNEVVVAVPASVFAGHGGPLVLAQLDDPDGFARLLSEEVERLNATASQQVFAIVDDPMQATDVTAEAVLWADDDLFAAAVDLEVLRELAPRTTDPTAPALTHGELHARLSEAYRRGVSWLVGVDLATLFEHAAAQGSGHEQVVLERLGLLDASTLVLERHRVGDSNATSANLTFADSRRGVAAWLADPAPMGSLEFVSPDATLATAAVAKDALDIFDELLDVMADADPNALAVFEAVQTELGFDLRSDLAATLGGEATAAVDGPLLPTPAWKVIVEVYDPGTLEATIERLVTEVGRMVVINDRPMLTIEQASAGDRTYWEIRHAESGWGVVYTMVDGYLVVAPERALIEQALQFRASGVNLPNSGAFRDLLPDNGYTDCSALVYRNFGRLADVVPTAALDELPPETTDALAEPSLFCVYGERDRIVVSGTGSTVFGAAPAFGLSSLMSKLHPNFSGGDPLSSLE